MNLVIVTPAHNELDNVDGLVLTIYSQTFQEFKWVVVDDESADGTADALRHADSRHLAEIVHKTNDGGLIGGSAFRSWRFGVEHALAKYSSITHVMKLDADVRLSPDYLERVMLLAVGDVGLAGGIIVTQGMVEQRFHVPGPVKLYTLGAYELTKQLPLAIGFDIMDDVLLKNAGYTVAVDRGAKFELARETGASEGIVHGRYRHGRGCRWTGYSFPYFMLRCARYFVRRPFVVGPFAMFWGYITAGKGPYPAALKRAHARQQRKKLADALRNPAKFLRAAYGD